MTEHHFIKYTNLWRMLEEIRCVDMTGTKLKADDFHKQIQRSRYVSIEYKYPADYRVTRKQNKLGKAFILHSDSSYTNKLSDLNKLLKEFKNMYEIILVSKYPMKSQVKKKITYDSAYSKHKFSTYLHVHFMVFMPEVLMVSKHSVLLPEEYKTEFHSIGINDISTLPHILKTDPQCIMIDAQHGDVIRIEKQTHETVHSINYRYVV